MSIVRFLGGVLMFAVSFAVFAHIQAAQVIVDLAAIYLAIHLINFGKQERLERCTVCGRPYFSPAAQCDSVLHQQLEMHRTTPRKDKVENG